MLRVALRNVHPDHLDTLRDWFRTADGPRRGEALATLTDESCTHEQAYLIEGKEGPVLVQIMEVGNGDQSKTAAAKSTHAIDADHKRVLQMALGGAVPSELLLDLHA